METFEYIKPQTLEEASSFMAEHSSAKIFAGGTDLLVQMRNRGLAPRYLVDIKNLDELRGISFDQSRGLTIGATTTLNAVAASPLVPERYGLLAQAAEAVGSYQIRNRATLGGNLCNASPSANTAPALLVLEATALIFGPKGERAVPLAEFFSGPKTTVLQPGEILTALQVPAPPPGAKGCYLKLGRCAAVDLSIAGVAVLGFPKPEANSSNDLSHYYRSGYEFRMALEAVAPTPIRVPRAEEILAQAVDDESIEKAARAARETARPISDVRGSQEYRLAMVHNLTRRAVREVLEGLGNRE